MRPPDLESKATMENRAQPRSEKDGKPVKRESRLGLRSIFARRRGASEVDEARGARNVATPEKRDSLPADGGPSYGLHLTGMQSDTHIASIGADSPSRPWPSAMKSPTSAAPKSPLSTSQKKRASLATWDPVPLFQAFPQAIRIATLPACVQGDSLLRVHYRRETLANANISHPDLGDQKATFVEMTRKKHRSNSSSCNLDWTTKIYALLTSGYLLQYAGEGTHDRLPEKVVHLCKDSAAFASDVIPGRHWVLQVTSIFDEGALVTPESRSLFGKLAMRDKEKRQASDMLMVFESAADMENWMTLLRREIESVGGRKPLTETGAPKEVEEDFDQVPPCPRTLGIKDPFRFASATSPDMRWDAFAAFDGSEVPPDATLADLLPDRTFDDNSTTNSFISHDGHQLEGLRDSSNRFSFMSAARTAVTSDSSPSSSPMRDSFGSQITDPDDATPLADDKTLVEVRRRPNAAEIDDRRKSYRTSNIFLDISANTTQPNHRGHASLSSIQDPPNFSLPHPGVRRRTVTSGEPVHIAYATAARPPRRPRHPPPSSLGLSRPLSIVADSPSPIKSTLETNSNANLRQLPDPSSMGTTWLANGQKSDCDMPRAMGQSSNTTGLQVPMASRPRKYASTNSLRPGGSPLCLEPPQVDLPVRAIVREPSPTGRAPGVVVEVSRSTHPAEPYQPPSRSRSPILRAAAAQRRGSTYSLQGSQAVPRQRSVSAFANDSAHRAMRSNHHDEAIRSRVRSPDPPREPRRNTVVTSHGHRRNESGSSDQSLLDSLSSLPQLPQARAHTSLPVPPVGPPPAPPPTKALPPLPPMHQRRSESNPSRMRMRSMSALGGQI